MNRLFLSAVIFGVLGVKIPPKKKPALKKKRKKALPKAKEQKVLPEAKTESTESTESPRFRSFAHYASFEFVGRLERVDVWLIDKDVIHLRYQDDSWRELTLREARCSPHSIWVSSVAMVEKFLAEQAPQNLANWNEAPYWIEAPNVSPGCITKATFLYVHISKTNAGGFTEPRPGNGIWRICQSCTPQIHTGENMTCYKRQNDGTYKKDQ